jgi:hypothetical protein
LNKNALARFITSVSPFLRVHQLAAFLMAPHKILGGLPEIVDTFHLWLQWGKMTDIFVKFHSSLCAYVELIWRATYITVEEKRNKKKKRKKKM